MVFVHDQDTGRDINVQNQVVFTSMPLVHSMVPSHGCLQMETLEKRPCGLLYSIDTAMPAPAPLQGVEMGREGWNEVVFSLVSLIIRPHIFHMPHCLQSKVMKAEGTQRKGALWIQGCDKRGFKRGSALHWCLERPLQTADRPLVLKSIW